MSGSVNKVILVGQVGNVQDLKESSSGTNYCWFSLATDRYAKNSEKKTTWHDIIAFGKVAENLHQIVGAGDTVVVEGRLDVAGEEKKVKVFAGMFSLLQKKNGSRRESKPSESPRAEQSPQNFNDDIPF